MKKRFLPILMAVLMVFGMVPMMAASAYADDTVVTVEGVHYSLNDDDMTATVTGHDIPLPEDTTILDVVSNEGAEYTVTRIGHEAFKGIPIESVTFMPGSKLKVIEKSAFSNCERLKDITIPAEVIEIGECAFENTGLKSVTFLKGSKLDVIGELSFAFCDELKSITIPASTRTIGTSAFISSGLTSVSMERPSSLELIDSSAFDFCRDLESIMIPGSVTMIGRDAFANCNSLNEVHYPGTQYDWDHIRKDDWAGPPVHFVKHRITKATPESYGEEKIYCPDCEQYNTKTTIEKPERFLLSATSYTYDGSAKTPDVTVIDSAGEIISGSNYDMSYTQNKNAGTATATVTFKGNYYAGSKDLTFTINKAANPMKITPRTATVKYSKVKKKTQTLKRSAVLTISKKQGTLSLKKMTGNKKITISKSSGKVTVKKGLKKGTYKVKVQVKAAGNTNYKALTKTVTFKVRVK